VLVRACGCGERGSRLPDVPADAPAWPCCRYQMQLSRASQSPMRACRYPMQPALLPLLCLIFPAHASCLPGWLQEKDVVLDAGAEIHLTGDNASIKDWMDMRRVGARSARGWHPPRHPSRPRCGWEGQCPAVQFAAGRKARMAGVTTGAEQRQSGGKVSCSHTSWCGQIWMRGMLGWPDHAGVAASNMGRRDSVQKCI